MSGVVAHNLVVAIGARRLLDRVSLEIAPGEVLAVLGENGAGKTTLLRALAGERAPTSGSVALDGRRLQHWKPRALAARRAVLPQDTSIAFRFTALETVLIGRYAFVRGDARTHDVAIARAALAKVDAAHLEARTVTELSGGERARVQLARVLAQLWEPVAGQPRFLLLDEPTASLDARHQLDVLALTRELAHAQGFGVLVVLHDLNLAARAADRVVLMKDGRIEAQGNPQAVFTATQLARCFGVEALVLPHPRRAHPYVVMA